MDLVKLVIGVKRRVFRVNDSQSAAADAEYKAKRPGALEAGRFTCIHCGYQSRTSTEIHHWDDDHRNNNDENLRCVCKVCHPHHHVGQASLDASASQVSEHLGKKTYMCALPEMSAAEFGLFQRAIGVALTDPSSSIVAVEILKRLGERAKAVKGTWTTLWPADFAAGMSNLPDNHYSNREAAVQDLRLLFHVDVLRQIGQETKTEHQSIPLSAWSKVARDVGSKVARAE